MNSFLNKLRLKWVLVRHGMDYTVDISNRIYKIYLNHNKIIHYRKGRPVYSLSTPALLSGPAANFFARTMYRSIQNKNLPNLMSFAVNDVCNATCDHCSFFEGVADKTKTVLSLEQCQEVIHDAQELGVSVINFVGGEPLLREDFSKIVGSVDKNLSTTIMFTNGLLLSQKVEELKKAGLDSVYISFGASTAEKNDKLKNTKGLFDAAIAGIKKAKQLGLSVGISHCATPESVEEGELVKIIELGKKIGVHEVLVFDAIPTGRYRHREDLIDNHRWIEKIIKLSETYNKDSKYPGVLVYAYLTSHCSVGCACGTSYFYVTPYGEIMPCDFNHRSFGSVLEKPLYQIWDEMTSSRHFSKSTWGGCKVKNSKYREKENLNCGGCSCKKGTKI